MLEKMEQRSRENYATVLFNANSHTNVVSVWNRSIGRAVVKDAVLRVPEPECGLDRAPNVDDESRAAPSVCGTLKCFDGLPSLLFCSTILPA